LQHVHRPKKKVLRKNAQHGDYVPYIPVDHEEDEGIVMAPSRPRPATIVVFLEEGAPETHELVSDKDWAVIFEDVLEIKTKGSVTYYPLDAVRKWAVS